MKAILGKIVQEWPKPFRNPQGLNPYKSGRDRIESPGLLVCWLPFKKILTTNNPILSERSQVKIYQVNEEG